MRQSGATTALLGRRNYEGFAGYWPPVADDPEAAEHDRALLSWLNKTEKVVFSTPFKNDSPWENTSITDADPAAEVRQPPGGAGR